MTTDILATNTRLIKSEESIQKDIKKLSKQVKTQINTNQTAPSTQDMQYEIERNLTATFGASVNEILNGMVANKLETLISTKINVTTLIQSTKLAPSSISKSPLTKLSNRDEYSTWKDLFPILAGATMSLFKHLVKTTHLGHYIFHTYLDQSENHDLYTITCQSIDKAIIASIIMGDHNLAAQQMECYCGNAWIPSS